MHFLFMYVGCWFGDPQSEHRDLKVWIESVSEFDLRAVDCQLRARNLCRKLAELLFSEEELKHGNATEARTSGVTLLDSHKLYAIRGDIKLVLTMCIYISNRANLQSVHFPFSFSSSLFLQVPKRGRI